LSANYISELYQQIISANYISKLYQQNVSANYISKLYQQNVEFPEIPKMFHRGGQDAVSSKMLKGNPDHLFIVLPNLFPPGKYFPQKRFSGNFLVGRNHETHKFAVFGAFAADLMMEALPAGTNFGGGGSF